MKHYNFKILCFFLIPFLLCSNCVMAQNNKWIIAGSESTKYQMGGNPDQKHLAKEPGFIKSDEKQISGFGTYMTAIDPGKYLGKRIKYSAYVKNENVNDWAGLWLRTDGKKKSSLTFDNMANRPIKGTSDWTKYEVVLDIPDSTTKIAYGLLLSGTGKTWFDGVKLEIVSNDVAVTNFDPVNDFINGNYERCLTVNDSGYLYNKFIKYFAFYKLGRDKEAAEYVNLLNPHDNDPWQQNLVNYLKGNIPEKEFLKLVTDKDKKRETEKKCEAYYYIGMSYWLPLKNINTIKNIEKAANYFQKCVATNQTDFIEYIIANVELKNLKKIK